MYVKAFNVLVDQANIEKEAVFATKEEAESKCLIGRSGSYQVYIHMSKCCGGINFVAISVTRINAHQSKSSRFLPCFQSRHLTCICSHWLLLTAAFEMFPLE